MLQRARELRKNQTEAEKRLWRYLRDRQLEGFKFRRQHPVCHYVLDFYCAEGRVAIEVDGGQHSDEKEKDLERTERLNEEGITVLRFWNHEVLDNTEGVLEKIREFLIDCPLR